MVRILDVESKESIILGDLNCNYLTNSDNSQLTQLKLIGEVYQLTQLIKEPTRVTQISSTLIDIIFTSDPSKIILSGVSHIGISDHSLVYAVCKIAVPTKNTHKYVTTRTFKKFQSRGIQN